MITNLLWCPVALPKFPVDNFLQEIEPLVAPQTKWANSWDAADISYGLLQTLRKKYTELNDWFNLLPCTDIHKIKLNVQNAGPVDLHLDIDPKKWTSPKRIKMFNKWLSQEPAGYRVLISGTRTNTFFAMLDNKKIYPAMPEDTDTYVFHSSSLLHGVKDDPGRKLVYLNLQIDESKHKELLEDSLNKYREYAIWAS